MKKLVLFGMLVVSINGFTQEMAEQSIEEPATWDLRCFPNPTSDLLMIKSSKEIASVDFFDINGREIKMLSLPNFCYSLSDLPEGWVFLIVTSVDGAVEKKNVYKQ